MSSASSPWTRQAPPRQNPSFNVVVGWKKSQEPPSQVGLAHSEKVHLPPEHDGDSQLMNRYLPPEQLTGSWHPSNTQCPAKHVLSSQFASAATTQESNTHDTTANAAPRAMACWRIAVSAPAHHRNHREAQGSTQDARWNTLCKRNPARFVASQGSRDMIQAHRDFFPVTLQSLQPLGVSCNHQKVHGSHVTTSAVVGCCLCVTRGRRAAWSSSALPAP